MAVREIKFRAFHEEKREGMTFPRMIDWEELSEDDELFFFLKNQLADVSPVMQYTGLKDKNGVEIYEGDIVHKTYKNSLTATGEVVYESATYFIREAEGHAFLYSGYDGEETEVIGNVYQNTELIEVNK